MSEVNISSFVFNKVKIEAKNLKKHEPSLSHMQCLDKASKKIAKKRHFHEVQKLHNNYLTAISVPKDLTQYQCPYCHLNFCPDLEEDIIDHNKQHRSWEKAEYYLSYLPRTYKEREKLKKVGYERISKYGKKFTHNEIIEGAYMLLQAYFDRSLDDALFGENWKEHPKFKEYIALVDHEKVFPKDVSNYFRKKYGRKEATHRSFWFPV